MYVALGDCFHADPRGYRHGAKTIATRFGSHAVQAQGAMLEFKRFLTENQALGASRVLLLQRVLNPLKEAWPSGLRHRS